jgi:V/A-type H+-transporting ATPase subunit E
MSGLDKILVQIIADAQEKAESIISEAKTRSEATLERMTAEAKREGEARIDAARTEAKAAVERSRSAAELRTKRSVLQERNRIIDEVLEDVKAQIRALPDAEYFSILNRFILSHSHKEPAVIVLNKRDLARLPNGFTASLSAELHAPVSISDMPGDFDAGCVLVYGPIEYNGTLSALISEKKDELRDLLNEELFGK